VCTIASIVAKNVCGRDHPRRLGRRRREQRCEQRIGSVRDAEAEGRAAGANSCSNATCWDRETGFIPSEIA
jgi:hypothetical protein